MNFAEQILRRKHEAMYKPPVVHPPGSPTNPPESSLGQRQPTSAQLQSALGADVILTRNGTIRTAPRNTNRTGSMRDINVDLDI